ncbi:GNAT family N-acetyltransferase [Brevibacillus brevis]|uniref:GNAT family N-acetyltransferase n=1 Tax=Brevibacillus brevis TaxID=1393 RepID=UPI000D0EC17F|nr:GNAT family N-acetyltransferase [Brevibacillus brevis]PSJ63222.1 hypothetical protein C7J99_31585 [Brevibacillus brevis]RED35845.1 ribosomal protein S18 acetylase RimI-like enzyme [Brevibacillus brevis]GEC93055.1 hypothetical protein BBR01nite_53860 [Brevibacillus brevis]VEF89046.1 putative acetyltransferase [Brevibacillus brevis]
MQNIIVRPYTPAVLDELQEIEKKMRKRFPDFPAWANWVYLHKPEIKPDNMYVAYEGRQAIGYGHLIPRFAHANDPSHVPNTIYLDMNASLEAEQPERVLDALYEALRARVGEMLVEALPRKTELCIQHYATVHPILDYAAGQGFERVESYRLLQRDLNMEIPDRLVRGDLKIREWKLETLADKEKFLAVNKLAFPEESATLEQLEGIISIPHFTTFAAFTPADEVVGVIMVRAEDATAGFIENVFVLPEFRGHGLAEALVAHGLFHLLKQGFQSVLLHVAASNVPACNLYQKAGFEIVKEQIEIRCDWNAQ